MLDNLTQKQKIILIVVSIIIVVGIIYFIFNSTDNSNPIDLDENILISNNTNTVDTSSKENLVIIHITGCVKSPGIVKLPEGSRMEDAIKAAGGLTENADISNVNLAYVLDDGQKIRIPSADEDANGNLITDDVGENIIIENNEGSKTININKASEVELSTLPGIGPTLAGKIVAYREENGKFKKIEDIKNVNGVGSSKYENIKDLISV